MTRNRNRAKREEDTVVAIGTNEIADFSHALNRDWVVWPTIQDDGKASRPPLDPSDFLWLMTGEPHCSRRLAILKEHPEV